MAMTAFQVFMKYVCRLLIISIIPAIVSGCEFEKSFEMLERPYTCSDFGGIRRDEGYSCAICKDGSILITGVTDSVNGTLKNVRDLTIDKNKTIYRVKDLWKLRRDKDLWILKIEPKENKILYNKCLGGSDDDRGYSIAETRDGNIIVAGTTRSTDGDLEGVMSGIASVEFSLRNSNSLWILKINPREDKILYNKRFGGIDDSAGYSSSIGETRDGNIIVTGSIKFENKLETSEPTHDGYELLVLVLDPEKNKVIYKRCFGGEKDEHGVSIVEEENGHLIVTGTTNSIDGDAPKVGFRFGKSSKSDPDIWLLKIDPKNDKILYNKRFGGNKLDIATSAIKCDDNSILIAGFTGSKDGHLLGKRIGSENDFDAWLLKVDIAKDKILYNRCFVTPGENCRIAAISQTRDNCIHIAAIQISRPRGVFSGTLVTEINPNLLGKKQIQYSRLFKEEANAIASTDDGKIIMTGLSRGKYKNLNLFLLKIDPPSPESPIN